MHDWSFPAEIAYGMSLVGAVANGHTQSWQIKTLGAN
jgi:hypothetical protein